jgi:hypothetical protein
VVDGGLLRIRSSRASKASIQKLDADDLPVVILVGDNVSDPEAEALLPTLLEGDIIIITQPIIKLIFQIVMKCFLRFFLVLPLTFYKTQTLELYPIVF